MQTSSELAQLRKEVKNKEHEWLKEKIGLEQQLSFQAITLEELRETAGKEKALNAQTVQALRQVNEDERTAMETNCARLADGYQQRQADNEARLKEAREDNLRLEQEAMAKEHQQQAELAHLREEWTARVQEYQQERQQMKDQVAALNKALKETQDTLEDSKRQEGECRYQQQKLSRQLEQTWKENDKEHSQYNKQLERMSMDLGRNSGQQQDISKALLVKESQVVGLLESLVKGQRQGEHLLEGRLLAQLQETVDTKQKEVALVQEENSRLTVQLGKLWQEHASSKLEAMALRKNKGRLQCSLQQILENHSLMDRQVKGLMFSYQIEERFVAVIRDKLEQNLESLNAMLAQLQEEGSDRPSLEDRQSFSEEPCRKRSSNHTFNQQSLEQSSKQHQTSKRSYFHDISPLRQRAEDSVEMQLLQNFIDLDQQVHTRMADARPVNPQEVHVMKENYFSLVKMIDEFGVSSRQVAEYQQRIYGLLEGMSIEQQKNSSGVEGENKFMREKVHYLFAGLMKIKAELQSEVPQEKTQVRQSVVQRMRASQEHSSQKSLGQNLSREAREKASPLEPCRKSRMRWPYKIS